MTSPRRSANKVYLPAPFGPTNPIRSPRLTWSETSSKRARFSATINTHPSTLNFFSQHCGKRAVSPCSMLCATRHLLAPLGQPLPKTSDRHISFQQKFSLTYFLQYVIPHCYGSNI